MLIKEPCIITPRLLLGIKIGDSFISIDYDGTSSDGRDIYKIYIDSPDFEYSDSEMKSGCQGGSLLRGLCSAISFMSACAESFGYNQRTGKPGENIDLYPPHVAEWCYDHSSDLEYLSCILEETENLISEG